MSEFPVHIPVMPNEVLELLNVKEDGTYIDATIGGGGHSQIILSRLNKGRLIGIDRDPYAIELCKKRFGNDSRVILFHANYAEMDKIVDRLGIKKVDGILIDAGISSFALDDPVRGFSFQKDGPLDMRMDTHERETMQSFLNKIDVDTLTMILKEYGDVPRARSVAKAIIERRDRGELHRISDLVEAVQMAYGALKKIPDETRQVFQALRIALNRELENLTRGIWSGLKILADGGRFVVISFHSGEDRVVKRIFREISSRKRLYTSEGKCYKILQPVARLLTPKPILPSSEEVVANPRCKSARLRAIELESGEELKFFLAEEYGNEGSFFKN